MLVSFEHACRKQNEKVILSDANMVIEDKDKIALIGVNGCGKTTLLNIISGKDTCEGTFFYKNGIRISYLTQNETFVEDETILYQLLHDQKEILEYEAKAILGKLGIFDYERKVNVLSGGERKRVALAKALLHPCDLLILDEPTNHLDHDMIEWLEGYLKKYTKAIFMVTHDRYFLERVCDKIIEMDHGTLYTYIANYSLYLQQKEERIQQNIAKEQKRKNILRKELAWMRAGVQARGTKSKDRIQRFHDLNNQRFYEEEQSLNMDLVTSRLGKKILECENIQKGYDHILFQNFNYVMKRHDRIGIVGKNGCGKSTLLKVLSKEIEPDEGIVIHGETLKIGYFHQGHEKMDLNQKVIDYIKDTSNAIQTSEGTYSASMMLERFLFPTSTHYLPIERLSGGEKRRLYLLKVLMSAPNVLLLDEPTNDLDIITLQILEDYLDNFDGALLAVSHDRYFLDRICDSLFVFENSYIQNIVGSYSEYRDSKVIQTYEKEEKVKKRSTTLKMSTKEKKELETMEETIEKYSLEIEKIDQKMESCGNDYNQINTLSEERMKLEETIEQLMIRWEELTLKQQEIEASKK